MTDFDRISDGFRRFISHRRRDRSNFAPIRAYIDELSRMLPPRSGRAKRLLVEIEDHLRESASQLCSRGLSPDEAATAAVAQFGSPQQIVDRFELEFPIESEVDAMLRYILMTVAAFTCLFGGALLALSGFDDARHGMFVTKIVASVVIALCCMTVFYSAWTRKSLSTGQRGVVLASALISIMVGSMGAVFTAHLGLVTHDWQTYGFAGAGLLVLQGALATVPLLFTDADRRELTA
jgi:hypothetical protein